MKQAHYQRHDPTKKNYTGSARGTYRVHNTCEGKVWKSSAQKASELNTSKHP